MKITRTNYGNPHLTLAFFQYAQTHSVESYLFGCLASAYNQLIITRWKCFRDLEGIEAALREMEVNGVGWDRFTQQEVGNVVEEVGNDILANGIGRWSMDVYGLLAKLERRVQNDIRDEEFKQEYRVDQRRKARGEILRKENPDWMAENRSRQRSDWLDDRRGWDDQNRQAEHDY